ncbi:MAG TPA: tyrosine-type recombinase/integrase, partial [Solirubrobacterales bacterium]
MSPIEPRPISGHVFRRKGKRGSVWYAKYRLPDGRQQKKRIGPAWTQKTAAPEGYFTKASAQAYLDELLLQARQGTLPGLVQTGKTFRDASADWLAYCENVRDCKPTTMRDYRNMVRVLDREFGDRKIESITTEEIELWVAGRKSANRTLQKYVVVLGGIFKRAMKLYGLPRNPVDIVERPRVRRAARIDVLRPEEVLALVRVAEEGSHRKEPEVNLGPRGKAALRRQDEMDAAIFHVAAFAGLRMGEILALRWRDIDFSRRTIHVRENWTQGETTTPKSGSERAVPMADEVAQRLARIGQREHFTGDEDLAFCTTGGIHLGYKSLKDR